MEERDEGTEVRQEQALVEGPQAGEAADGRQEGAPGQRSVRELSRYELGRRGEDIAADYLERRGMTILERNWRCGYGEADIIALDESGEHEEVVLVEVKTRLALGEPVEVVPEIAVNAQKRTRYRQMALCYLAEHPEAQNVRFDVIALIVVGERGAKLRHLFGAFSWDE